MVSNEEILERAFLSALRQHFKKPGPWNPIQNLSANARFPSNDGVTEGQVWEFFIRTSGNIRLANPTNMNTFMPLGTTSIDVMQPATIFYNPGDTITGEIGTPGLADTALTVATMVTAYQSKTEGWLLTGKEVVTADQAFSIRARRRFDLET